MPRVRLAVPAEQRKIEADLTEHCTGGARYADMTQIGRYLGIENRRIVAEFLDGLPCLQRGTKKKWRVDDLAARILEATK